MAIDTPRTYSEHVRACTRGRIVDARVTQLARLADEIDPDFPPAGFLVGVVAVCLADGQRGRQALARVVGVIRDLIVSEIKGSIQ